MRANTHAIIHSIRIDASQRNDLSERLFDTAGEGVRQIFRQYLNEHASCTAGRCFITPAGNLHPITRIAHMVSAFDSTQVQSETLICLQTVIAHHENISSIAIPFLDSLGNNTFWDISQQYAKAVNNFDAAQTEQPSYLTKIDFVCQDITAASVVQTVFHHTIKMTLQTQANSSIDTSSADSPRRL